MIDDSLSPILTVAFSYFPTCSLFFTLCPNPSRAEPAEQASLYSWNQLLYTTNEQTQRPSVRHIWLGASASSYRVDKLGLVLLCVTV
ncbi:hypothetical protein B0H19DRAFT_1112245 [Mycena capillaripes]|nr:hypothetical protein B0H19DRAFT_1112245 [Mycena capillaripes]